MLDRKHEPPTGPEPGPDEATPSRPARRPPSAREIEDWLAAYLSKVLEIEDEKVDPAISFSRFGLDSSASIFMLSDLSDWLGREIDPDLLYSHPTIEALAKRLAG